MEYQENHHSIAAILQREFEKRVANNSRYSLRAFARALEVSPSYLSRIISKKRTPALKRAKLLSEQLQLTPVETALLLESCRDFQQNDSIDSKHLLLDMDTFELIANWHHYAILNLLHIPSVRNDIQWMAKRLGTTLMEVKFAVARLERLGFIAKVKGKWKRLCDFIRNENKRSTEATRRFHHKLIEKALHSLENDPFEIRDHSSLTMAIDPKLIPYARERIRKFRIKLADELTSMGKPKEVYNLTMQLYPVTRSGGNK